MTGRSNLGNIAPLVTVATVNLNVSNNPSFLGTPITFQSVLFAPSGGNPSVAFSSSLAFVMR